MLVTKTFVRMAAVGAFVLPLLIPATSTANSEEFRVDLIATIDDGPAMENVQWRLYKDGAEEYASAERHITHVTVPSGKYSVVAKLTSSNRTVKRSFWVRDDTQVVIPLDE